jgi:hypothetical protein
MNLCWFLVGLPGSDAHPWIGTDNRLAQCPSGTRKSLLVPSWSCLGLGLKRKFTFSQKSFSHFCENYLENIRKYLSGTCEKRGSFRDNFCLFLNVRKKCVRRKLMRAAALKIAY